MLCDKLHRLHCFFVVGFLRLQHPGFSMLRGSWDDVGRKADAINMPSMFNMYGKCRIITMVSIYCSLFVA